MRATWLSWRRRSCVYPVDYTHNEVLPAESVSTYGEQLKLEVMGRRLNAIGPSGPGRYASCNFAVSLEAPGIGEGVV
jgi:hypothetical protein